LSRIPERSIGSSTGTPVNRRYGEKRHIPDFDARLTVKITDAVGAIAVIADMALT
jgi:hypothetical protein